MKSIYAKIIVVAGVLCCAPNVLWDLRCEAAAGRPTIPDPLIFMVGWSDDIGNKPLFGWTNADYQAAWQRLIPHLTAVVGTTVNADFVNSLKAQGKLFVYLVHQPNHVAESSLTSKALSEEWSVPFKNTLGGKLPGGFDAVCIDEFGYPDGSPRSKMDVEALEALRKDYPDKLIFVFGGAPMGDGGPESQFGKKTVTYDVELKATNKYADLLIHENYQLQARPEKLSLLEKAPRNLESRSPGLAKKTVYALYICEVGVPSYGGPFEESFENFVRRQVHLVKERRSSPKIRNGFGFYLMLRAKPKTVDGIINVLSELEAGK